jgi:hypothetical protein
MLHDVACVEEACTESVQKIKENARHAKSRKRMKESETVVGVEKRIENLCMW